MRPGYRPFQAPASAVHPLLPPDVQSQLVALLADALVLDYRAYPTIPT
jgi:hypothetical protein